MGELTEIPWPEVDEEEPAAAPAPFSLRDRRELFEAGSEVAPVAREQIAGIDAVVERVDELVHWLDNASRYRAHGARLEPGVLFEGPPGTGKTLLARYLATRAEALFVDVRDFPRATAGLRPGDVEALFGLARDAASEGRPVVLFWDELERVAGREPAAGPGAPATVAALLAELDGARGKPDGVLLVGCANDAELLDPALLHPGRMGERVSFGPPDREGRRALISHYVARLERDGELDVPLLAELFPEGVTASEIEEAVAEAWRLAVGRAIREDREPALTQADMVVTLSRRLAGAPVSAALAPAERLRVAVHEVGHGLVAVALGLDLLLVSAEEGTTAGRTVTGELGQIPPLEALVARISMGLAGGAAEQVALGSRGAGAASDNLQASGEALRLVEIHGAASTPTRSCAGGGPGAPTPPSGCSPMSTPTPASCSPVPNTLPSGCCGGSGESGSSGSPPDSTPGAR